MRKGTTFYPCHHRRTFSARPPPDAVVFRLRAQMKAGYVLNVSAALAGTEAVFASRGTENKRQVLKINNGRQTLK